MGTELLTSVPRAIAETPAGSTLGALELVGMERAGVVSRCFPAQGVSHLYSSVTQEVGAMWIPLWASVCTGASQHALWLP